MPRLLSSDCFAALPRLLLRLILRIARLSLPRSGIGQATLTTSAKNGAFPPNTQFQLKEIKEAGDWEAPSDGKGGAPVKPMQRLLVVTCTYQLPKTDATGKIAQQLASYAPKMCCGAATMGFGRREAFIAGLDGLTARPLLTMAEEFDRDLSWVDITGAKHTCREEWSYVSGTAETLELHALGLTRDKEHAGKTPDGFLREANAFITKRRRAGSFSLPEQHAFLSIEEVLAVRLFSGAAYRPINDFLRNVATGVQPWTELATSDPLVPPLLLPTLLLPTLLLPTLVMTRV